MLRWALGFLLIAIIAGIFGFGGVAEAAVDISVFLFYLFAVLFVAALVIGVFTGRDHTGRLE